MMNYLEADGGDDDSRPSEDYNTKKVRFEDGFDVVAMDMVVDIDPSLSVGSTESVTEFMESDGGSDGDHILFEGDVIRSTVNGILIIDFLDRVKQILYKKIKTMIIEYYEKVLTHGPWIINGQYLIV
ncbi:hypothetical protein PVK06_027943 [Gossypium arboreum]|uniref:Uncharacterized protein n=1 Tax=Gossypium arboreum TaxID=29729 RepID=A0ABR0P1K1_GOSAR|nr:hypothetical protein PVK06_027943 [Gossypium arboreum]